MVTARLRTNPMGVLINEASAPARHAEHSRFLTDSRSYLSLFAGGKSSDSFGVILGEKSGFTDDGLRRPWVVLLTSLTAR